MDMPSPMDSPPPPDVKSVEEFVPSRQELYLQFLEERDFAYYSKVLCDMQKHIKSVKDSGILQKVRYFKRHQIIFMCYFSCVQTLKTICRPSRTLRNSFKRVRHVFFC